MSNIDKVAEVMKAHDLFCYKYGNGWTEPHEEVIRCACGEEFYSYIQTGDGSYDDDRDPDALYRQHLTQALADAGLLMPEDEELAGLRCEYRVIHPTPGAMTPTPLLHSEAEADKAIASARHIIGNDLADQLTIQRRLIGEWEDIE